MGGRRARALCRQKKKAVGVQGETEESQKIVVNERPEVTCCRIPFLRSGGRGGRIRNCPASRGLKAGATDGGLPSRSGLAACSLGRAAHGKRDRDQALNGWSGRAVPTPQRCPVGAAAAPAALTESAAASRTRQAASAAPRSRKIMAGREGAPRPPRKPRPLQDCATLLASATRSSLWPEQRPHADEFL